ncbi:hypothetical protein JCM6882_000024 [Rhodosporidiobolus microsporus]
MATLRSSAKTSRLASALHQLRAGPSARPLPPIVSSLSVRSEGVKGNAGARKWAKAVLPGVAFSNPAVKIQLEKVEKAEGDESWSQTPGVTVSFNDPSLSPVFFPLSQQRSDKLISKFWATFGEERTLRAFAEGKEVEQPELAVAEQQQEPEAAAAPAGEVVEVALSGAHALSRCHIDRSGFDGPWQYAPATFSNEYFRLLFEEKWGERKWGGPPQFENKSDKSLMMLRTDVALTTDKNFRPYAQKYAKDEQAFFADFSKAFSKLLHLGVPSTQLSEAVQLKKIEDQPQAAGAA